MVNIVERYGNEIKQLSHEERLELATLILNTLKDETQTALPRPSKRPIGLAEGQFVVPADFNDPLPDELLDAFEDTIALDEAYLAIETAPPGVYFAPLEGEQPATKDLTREIMKQMRAKLPRR